jgi:hypothetical protein
MKSILLLSPRPETNWFYHFTELQLIRNAISNEAARLLEFVKFVIDALCISGIAVESTVRNNVT